MMNIIKNIISWILVCFFVLMAIALKDGVSCVFAVVSVLLLLPIKKWQAFIKKIFNNKIKIIAVILCFVLAVAFTPTPENSGDETLTVTESNTQQISKETTFLDDNKLKEPTTKETAKSTEKEEAESNTDEATKIEATTQKETKESNTTTKVTTTNKHHILTTQKTDTETTTKTVSNVTTIHTHRFIEATCTSPRICSDCGVTDGIATGHNFYLGSCVSCGLTDPDYVSEEMVWIPTRGGSKYHSKSTCSGMIDPEYVTKTEAINRGFGPCGRCY